MGSMRIANLFPDRHCADRSCVESNLSRLGSTVARWEHLESEWFDRSRTALNFPPVEAQAKGISWRKAWEWAAILEVLDSRGMLEKGRKGIGFAVGTEQLPSIMAKGGVKVLATDLSADETTDKWTSTGQHAASLDALFHPFFVSRQVFDDQVAFQAVNMNHLEDLPSEQFDFAWSSCALEHIGTLDDGLNFVVNCMRLLKPGGVAVHTTEYNVSSNDDTIAGGGDCIYRRQDIERLDGMLRLQSCGLERVDFDAGWHPNDLNFDRPPFFSGNGVHLKLELYGHVATSVLLVCHKGRRA